MVSSTSTITVPVDDYNELRQRLRDFESSLEEHCLIRKDEYNQLRKIAERHANLRKSLLHGDCTEAAIDVCGLESQCSNVKSSEQADRLKQLCQGDNAGEAQPVTAAQAAQYPAISPQHRHTDREDALSTCLVQKIAFRSKSNAQKSPHSGRTSSSPAWAADSVSPASNEDGPSLFDATAACNEHQPSPESMSRAYRTQPYEKVCDRSIYLSRLPTGVSHGDITEILRGGQILDVHVRTQDRSACVAFLKAEDAKAFLDHARRHGVYIKLKRIDVRSADRHFTLGDPAAKKIAAGATRNLVIRGINPSITEQEIRGDLEHIDKLVVIKVEFVGGSCYIRTNSVNNAMFARTCMQSRSKYKATKIEFDVDECCEPLPVIEHRAAPANGSATTKKSQSRKLKNVANRFDLLKTLGNDDEDEEEVVAGEEDEDD